MTASLNNLPWDLTGTFAERPAPTGLREGTIYFASDVPAGYFVRVDPVTRIHTWIAIGTGGGGSGPMKWSGAFNFTGAPITSWIADDTALTTTVLLLEYTVPRAGLRIAETGLNIIHNDLGVGDHVNVNMTINGVSIGGFVIASGESGIKIITPNFPIVAGSTIGVQHVHTGPTAAGFLRYTVLADIALQ